MKNDEWVDITPEETKGDDEWVDIAPEQPKAEDGEWVDIAPENGGKDGEWVDIDPNETAAPEKKSLGIFGTLGAQTDLKAGREVGTVETIAENTPVVGQIMDAEYNRQWHVIKRLYEGDFNDAIEATKLARSLGFSDEDVRRINDEAGYGGKNLLGNYTKFDMEKGKALFKELVAPEFAKRLAARQSAEQKLAENDLNWAQKGIVGGVGATKLIGSMANAPLAAATLGIDATNRAAQQLEGKWVLDENGQPTKIWWQTDENGDPVRDEAGNLVPREEMSQDMAMLKGFAGAATERFIWMGLGKVAKAAGGALVGAAEKTAAGAAVSEAIAKATSGTLKGVEEATEWLGKSSLGRGVLNVGKALGWLNEKGKFGSIPGMMVKSRIQEFADDVVGLNVADPAEREAFTDWLGKFVSVKENAELFTEMLAMHLAMKAGGASLNLAGRGLEKIGLKEAREFDRKNAIGRRVEETVAELVGEERAAKLTDKDLVNLYRIVTSDGFTAERAEQVADKIAGDIDEAQKLIDEGASLSSLAEGLKARRQYSDQFVEGAKAAAAELRDRVTLDGAQSAKINDAALKAAEGNVEIAAKVAALAKSRLTNKHTQVDDADGLESLVAEAMRPFAPEARAVKIHDMRGNRNVGQQLAALDELGITSVEDAELNGIVRRDENGRLTGGARQAVNIAANGTDALKTAIKDGSIDAETAEALITASHTELGTGTPEARGALIDGILERANGDNALARRMVELAEDGNTLTPVGKPFMDALAERAKASLALEEPRQARLNEITGCKLSSIEGGMLGCSRFRSMTAQFGESTDESGNVTKKLSINGLGEGQLAKPGNWADGAVLVAELQRIAEKNGAILDFGSVEANTEAAGLLAKVESEGLARAKAKLETRANLVDILARTALDTGVTWDEASFRKALAETANGRQFIDRHGNIYGFASSDGTLHFNPLGLDYNIPIHEYGHLALESLKGVNRKLWERGMELVKQSDYYRQIKEESETDGHEYSYLKGNDLGICDEALATLIGDNGEKLVEAQGVGAELKAWLKEFWTAFKGAFGLADLGEAQIEKMTLGEFVDTVNAELLRGKDFGTRKQVPPKEKSIKRYDEADGSGSNGLLRWKNDRGRLFNIPVDMERTQPGGKVVFAPDDVNITDWIADQLDGYTLRMSKKGKVYVEGRDGFDGRLAEIFGRYPTIGKNDGIFETMAEELQNERLRDLTPDKLVDMLAKDRANYDRWVKATRDGKTSLEDTRMEEYYSEQAAREEAEARQRWEDSGMDVPEYILSRIEEGEPGFDLDWETMRELAHEEAEGRFAVGGRVAASNMGIKGAAEAEAMEKTGADREKIWRETGWWKGKDGKWRFELPRMRREAWHGDPEERHFTGGGDDFYRYRLTELVKNDDFFKAYPQAKKITVEFHKGMPTNVGGNFNEATLTIKLPQKYQVITDYAKYGLGEGKAAGLNAAGAKTIEHELQHAVQLFEGFAKGGSPSDPVRPYALDGDTGHALSVFAEANGMDVTNDRHLAIIASNAQKIASDQTRGEMSKRLVEAFEAAAKVAGKTPAEFSDEINRLYDSHTDSPMGQYFKLAGEVEARNAQFRANMTPEERAATPPWETEDVPESRQIVKFAVGRVDGKDMAVIVHEPMRKADMKNEKKVKDYLVENLVGREYRQAGEEKLVKVAPALAKEYWGGSYSSKIRDRFEKLWQAKVGAASVMEDIVGTTPLGGAEAPKSTGKRQSFKKGATFYRCKTTFGALTTDDKVAKYPCELVLLELANGKRFVYDIVNIRNPTLAHDSPKGEALEALKAQTSARSRTTDDIIAQTGAGAQGGERSFNGVTPEQDAAYAEAVKRGDLETARRMEREVYERMGYSDDSSYQGTSAFNGAAPSRNAYFETKAERIEAAKNGEMEDTTTLGDYRDGIDVNNLQFIVFDPRSERNADPMRQEAIRNIRGVLDSGAKTITMYRSVPADVKEGQFRNGDWITPSRAYAEENAQIHGWGDKFRIIEQEVSVEDVWWDGNDIAEWGFDDGKGSVYKNTLANRKLLGPTYDDAGNLIPLSKRFNDWKNDAKFAVAVGSLTGGKKNGRLSDVDQKRLTAVMRGLGTGELKHPRFTTEEFAASKGTEHEQLWNYILSLESPDVDGGGAQAFNRGKRGAGAQSGDRLGRLRRVATRYGRDPKEIASAIPAVKEVTVNVEEATGAKTRVALGALSGKDLLNIATGITARINATQRNKIVSNAALRKSKINGFSGKEHFAAAANIENLWKHAELLENRADRDGDINIASIKRFASPVFLDNKLAFAYLTAKESIEHGHRIYSIELESLEALSGTLKGHIPPTDNASKIASNSDFDSIVANGAAEVNPRQQSFDVSPSGKGEGKFSAGGQVVGDWIVGPNGIARRGTPQATMIGGARVADDAGRGEQTPGSMAAALERLNQPRTTIRNVGQVRPMSLPLSEMEALRKMLTGDHLPATIAKKIARGGFAAHTKAGRLTIAASVFGLVDKTDVAPAKDRLKQHGFFRNEDEAWAANHSEIEVRRERERSEGQLGDELLKLADRRARGAEAGGESAARGVYANELAKIVMDMPRKEGGVIGRVQKIGDAVRTNVKAILGERGTGNRERMAEEAKRFLDWARGGAEEQGAEKSERELTDEMFASWLIMPEEMGKIAPTWSEAILRTVAETPKLAEAFKELSFRALSKDSHRAVFEAVRKSQGLAVEKALKELEADRTEKISAGSRLADAKEKVIVTFHDTLGAVAVRIDEKTRQYLKARRKVLAEMKARGATKADIAAVENEIDLFSQKIGHLKNRMELSRTAMERGTWNEGRRYMLQYLLLENKATKKWGLSEEDKSAYLDMMRIVETQGRAASYGMDPRQARLALGDMARRLGAEKWARLEEYGREFFSVMEREFLNDPRVERMWGKGMIDYFRTQAHYVTTKRVQSAEELDAIETARAKARAAGVNGGDDVIGAMFTYAGPRGGASALGLNESAWKAKLTGSMGAKQEVRSATWEKQQMLMQSARRNQFILDLRDALLEAKVEGVRDVERGEKDVKPGSRYGTINYVENGARRTLIVPKQIAEGMKATPDNMPWLTKFHNAARGLMIDWNVAYWNRNVMRNSGSIEKNMPGMHETWLKTVLRVAPGLAPTVDLACQHLARHSKGAAKAMTALFGRDTIFPYIQQAGRMAKLLEDPTAWQEQLWDAEARGDTAEVAEMHEDLRQTMEMLKGNMFLPNKAAYGNRETQGFANDMMNKAGFRMVAQMQRQAARTRLGRAVDLVKSPFKRNERQQEYEDVLAKSIAYLHDRAVYGVQRSVEESGLTVKRNVSIAEGERKGSESRTVQRYMTQFFNMTEKGVTRTVRAMRERPGETLGKMARTWVGRFVGSAITYGLVTRAIRALYGDDEEKAKASPLGGVYGYAKWVERANKNLSNYVRNHYQTIPVWVSDDGYTTIVLGAPLNDEDSLLAPSADFAAKAFANAMGAKNDLALGQMLADTFIRPVTPDLAIATPALKVIRDTVMAAMVENPTDLFTGAPTYDRDLYALRNESWETRGDFALAMARQVWNDVGARGLVAWDRNGVDNGMGSAPKWIGLALKKIPILSPVVNSFAKVQVGSPEKDAKPIRADEQRLQHVRNYLSRKLMLESSGKGGALNRTDPQRYAELLEQWQGEYGLSDHDMRLIEKRFLNGWTEHENEDAHRRKVINSTLRKARRMGIDEADKLMIRGDL